jgi:hypothetical protein
MDLLIVLLIILGCMIFGSLFFGAAKFHHKNPENQKTKYNSHLHAGNLRVNKTRNPYSLK